VLEKIRTLRAELARRGLSTIIESDGGINDRTIGAFAEAGVDVFVMGSSVFESNDYAGTLARMRREAERGQRAAAPK
jgi:ribulose-phosphate 3-epimerase